jgi:hypothetical protein
MRAESILQELCQLGKTPDEIAAELRRRAIKGTRSQKYLCPIAIVVSRKIQRMKTGIFRYTVFVDRMSTQIFTNETTSWKLKLHIENPQPIGDFVNWFDGGRYIDLEVTLEHFLGANE